MLKNLKICPVKEDDIPDILDIERASFSEDWSEELLKRELALSFSRMLGVRANGKLVGYVLFWILGEVCELHRIAVHPQFRSKGIGTFLMKGFLDKAEKEGVKEVVLEVDERNISAISLYERFGFNRITIRSGYYGNSNAIVMRLKLDSGRKGC